MTIATTPTSIEITDAHEAVVKATTDHAWDEPRGEVYLSVTEPDAGPEGEEMELMIALTPKQAEILADNLLELAAAARECPEATLTIFGDRL